MSEVAITVEGIGKQYRIGPSAGKGMYRYKSLRDSLGTVARRPWSVVTDRRRLTEDNSFWALKDVGFEVKRGEVVGIIGRNGAGKSTLLKILSRITKPTEGQIALHGRVGSLLEVGTGFHPELSGRENVFLNGAVLGMTRGEVKSKFDEIVAFSEIERFLDTPVKQYSSGMYTRLAFAVAAHLEPEILVIDEVLAVGDAAFQKKCLGKMQDVASEGRTVIFVSHTMPMITRLCSRCVLLDQGRVERVGGTPEVTQEYLTGGGRNASCVHQWMPGRLPGDDQARLKGVRVLNSDGEPAEVLQIQDPVTVELEYLLKPGCMARPAIHLKNDEDVLIFVSVGGTPGQQTSHPSDQVLRSKVTIPANFLAEKVYYVSPTLCTFNPNHVHCFERDSVQFRVVDHTDGEGARGDISVNWPGLVRPRLDWHTAGGED